MASILDKYGIKEVCDFTFYEISEETGNPTNPVLYLDTLKVSTVEQSGDESEARGGKGNSLLLIWDTNKELTVNLEDALFSAYKDRDKKDAKLSLDGFVVKISKKQRQISEDTDKLCKTIF